MTVPLPDGLQVGEHLAGVELVGERVDHRHSRDTSHRFDTALSVGPPHHGVGIAGQHPRGVLDGLLATQLHRPGVDDHRVAAELGDADLEGQPGSRRALLEDHRNGSRTGQRVATERFGLELVGQVEDLLLLGRREVVIAQEVSRHRYRTPLRIAGSALRNSRACASVSTRGGASRIRSGTAGLTRKPASRAAVATWADSRRVEPDPDEQSGRADRADQRVVQRGHLGGDVLAEPGDVVEQSVARRSSAGPPARPHSTTGLPPNVLPW